MPGAVFSEGENVNLRTLEEDDAEFLRNLNHDPDVREFLGRVPEPSSLRQEREKINSTNESDEIIQFIIEKDGEDVGTIAIFDINRTHKSAEIGAFMIKPGTHGNGLGTEAMKLTLEYAFNQLNMNRIQGGYLEGNEASKAVQEKFGFQKEGRERKAIFRDGEYKDIIRTSLLEEEWRES